MIARLCWWLAYRFRCRWFNVGRDGYRVCRDGEKCRGCDVR